MEISAFVKIVIGKEIRLAVGRSVTNRGVYIVHISVRFVAYPGMAKLGYLFIGKIKICIANIGRRAAKRIIPSNIAMVPFAINFHGAPFMISARRTDNTGTLNANGVTYGLKRFSIGFANAKTVN